MGRDGKGKWVNWPNFLIEVSEILCQTTVVTLYLSSSAADEYGEYCGACPRRGPVRLRLGRRRHHRQIEVHALICQFATSPFLLSRVLSMFTI